MTKKLLSITDAAADHAKTLLADAPDNTIGLNIKIKTTGCSGYSYDIQFATEENKFSDMVEHNGVKIFIDPMAMMYILGSEMDYQSDKLKSGFVFKNPNEKGRCGCGESFHV